ncbi:MAG: 6-phosphofructokinase [Bacteroidales bacterium]|jgi:ATP-dependent phosphofructokinase / diphosphate-dependent phosphofructokinase|nr:6-phosphofructokinase [Bacteroidales bacterium]MDD2204540.1 6-phosphofructokinase [Bacteroidales bacterium]MDD3152660.1 6-phosphofructokinase [Bacteroidales bacterium]MDD3913481.1 6-phosphofructokinase [Bacteroidales bacterium]MDD4633970.1 6-phosphofructokinase [Bacteroidales bacterium]
MKKAIAILCGGGPAPGINTVISSTAKVFLKHGYRVIGLHEGFKSLFTYRLREMDITFEKADEIRQLGGSILAMSRYKPSDMSRLNIDFFINNNIKLLVTIGGDDTATTAVRVSEYLHENSYSIQNIHVPKTIDNDLFLPEGTPTFGFQSATAEGVKLATTIYEDARTSGTWFVIASMGREAGHLAFGIGAAAHYPMIIIPEMFNKTKITFDKITNLIISSMLKRKILGIDYGAAIISEGVFHSMTDSEIEATGINFTYDEHGHPELGPVSKAHIFNVLLQHKLQKETRLQTKSRPVELGYELRCVNPIAYDLMYCSLLGTGVKQLFDKNYTACMVCADSKGDISPIFMKDIIDPKTNKMKTRFFNIESQQAHLVFDENLHYISEEDYEDVLQYVDNPEEYDFKKILCW